jgi:hypothetical protein
LKWGRGRLTGKGHWISYLTLSVWKMAALPKIVEDIFSGVLVVFEFFHFM